MACGQPRPQSKLVVSPESTSRSPVQPCNAKSQQSCTCVDTPLLYLESSVRSQMSHAAQVGRRRRHAGHLGSLLHRRADLARPAQRPGLLARRPGSPKRRLLLGVEAGKDALESAIQLSDRPVSFRPVRHRVHVGVRALGPNRLRPQSQTKVQRRGRQVCRTWRDLDIRLAVCQGRHVREIGLQPPHASSRVPSLACLRAVKQGALSKRTGDSLVETSFPRRLAFARPGFRHRQRAPS